MPRTRLPSFHRGSREGYSSFFDGRKSGPVGEIVNLTHRARTDTRHSESFEALARGHLVPLGSRRRAHKPMPMIKA